MDSATALAVSTVTMTVPLLYVSLGELIGERSGIVNIGLEGMMIVGAFAALLGAHHSGAWEVGFVLALACGAGLGALLAFFVVARGANQVVAGTALNLLGLGLTGVGYRAAFGVTGAALSVDAARTVPLPFLSEIPLIGPALFSQSPLVYLALAVVPALSWALFATAPGLWLRMVGENPGAAETEGISVLRTRTAALIGCGGFAAAGGAFLVLAHTHTFIEGMTAGRGFIALAIVIVGRWSPVGVMIAAALFGLATALQFHVQALGLPIPYQLLLMLPYLLTITVLAVLGSHFRPPASLGRPYRRG